MKVKSTKVFKKRVSVKIILIGQSSAGKTNFLNTVEENRSVLMPAGADGRTIGIELTVLNIHVHPDIRCYAYDFGGQQEYYPLHQAIITPHSFYILFVDFWDLYCNIDDAERFDADVVHFYYTVYQRVHAPVLQVVGSKADLLSHEQQQHCNDTLIRKLDEIEKKEMNILEKRKEELENAIRMKEFVTPGYKSRFDELTVQDLHDKIKEVEMLKEARPKLPKRVIMVSSKDCTGVTDWKEDVAERILQNKEFFPSMEVPETWLRFIDHLDENKANNESVLDRETFLAMSEDFEITNEEEKRVLTQHLRIAGQILSFENHPTLINTIFLYPDMILNAMSAVFNHEHFEDKFWKQNDTMKQLPLPTQQMHKRNFQEYGITTQAVMHSFLREKGVTSNFDKFIDLMIKIDLCFKIKDIESCTLGISDECSNVGFDEGCYIIPSLLKTQPSATMNRIWPQMRADAQNEIFVSLNLTTGREPTGLFEQITTRINPHLKRRCDVQYSTVAEINKAGDTFKFSLEPSGSSWHSTMMNRVRHGPGRHKNAVNFHKIIITRMINVLSNYPNVLFDFFAICPPCLLDGRDGSELLPAEATLLSSQPTKQNFKCANFECSASYDFKTGLALSEGGCSKLFIYHISILIITTL